MTMKPRRSGYPFAISRAAVFGLHLDPELQAFEFCHASDPADRNNTCYRARGHRGRHAEIDSDGTVWAVWGRRDR